MFYRKHIMTFFMLQIMIPKPDTNHEAHQCTVNPLKVNDKSFQVGTISVTMKPLWRSLFRPDHTGAQLPNNQKVLSSSNFNL